jgi:hypothetical protein
MSFDKDDFYISETLEGWVGRSAKGGETTTKQTIHAL